MTGDTNPTTPAAVDWTAAEREAVTDICTHEGLGKACDRCRDTISDALDALAPFVAERERAAAAKALNSAADDLPRLIEGPGQAGTATWPAHDRAIYSLAVEESQDALRARAEAHDRAIYSLAVEESQDALRARAERIEREGQP